MNKNTSLALFTHAFCKFDIYLFGIMAPLLAEKFFSKSEDIYVLSYLTFAIGYIARPFGALIGNYIGDHYGRKYSFIFTSIITIFAGVSFGFIPTYDQVGIYASILLVTMRLLQGIGGGSEFASIFIYVGEQKSFNNTLCSSVVRAAGYIGISFAAIFTAFILRLDSLDRIWRVPFMFAAIIALIGFLLRFNIKESEEYNKAKSIITSTNYFHKLRSLVRNKKIFLKNLLIQTVGYSLSYFCLIYFNSMYKVIFDLTNVEIIIITSGIALIFAISSIFAGVLSVRISELLLMKISLMLALIITISVFAFYEYIVNNIRIFIILHILLSAVVTMFFAPSSFLYFKLYEIETRLTAISIINTISQALLGSTTPLICSLIVSYTNDNSFVFVFASLMCVVGIYSLNIIPEETKEHS
jgi:MFS family permease